MATGVWLRERGDHGARGEAATAAGAPQLEVEVLSSRGDHLTVQVVRGVLEDPAAVLHVELHGDFELVRVERWPAPAGPPRVLLTLRAWPGP